MTVRIITHCIRSTKVNAAVDNFEPSSPPPHNIIMVLYDSLPVPLPMNRPQARRLCYLCTPVNTVLNSSEIFVMQTWARGKSHYRRTEIFRTSQCTDISTGLTATTSIIKSTYMHSWFHLRLRWSSLKRLWCHIHLFRKMIAENVNNSC